MGNKQKQKKDVVNTSWARINPIANAALTINQLHHQVLDFSTVANEMCDSFSKVKKGNLVEVEAMLLSQAQILNVFFNQCLSRVADTKFLNQIQVMSDLALRAQNNCRKTLATLADIKNPKRAMFIKQQNNAIGNQQINNSENLKNPANEVLSEVQYESLDNRSKEEAITINPMLATMDPVDRR